MSDKSVRYWTDDEPGWAEAAQEIARIKRRVRARFWLTLLLATLFTALIAYKQSRKKQTYRTAIVLRVTEGVYDPKSAPPTTAKLQDYLWDVAFSRKHLEALIVKRGLYKSLYHIDPNLAVEEFRDVLDIKVVRNYFAKERYPDDPPRSARLAISYAGPTPKMALQVTRDLAHLAEKQENSSRRLTAKNTDASMAQSTTTINLNLARLRKSIAKLQARYPKAEGHERAAIYVKIQSMGKQAKSLRDQLRFVGARKTKYELSKGVGSRDLGLRFEMVDPGREPKVLLTDTARLIMISLVSFFFLFPVVGVGIGAYDLKVYDIEDVRRLGIEPFGHIPRFPGYESGSLEQRLKTS